jgi:hypothetical protein
MTARFSLYSSGGATFSEVLVAMALTSVGLMGTMGAFHAAQLSIAQAVLATRAVGLAESRLEAKRAAQWAHLLTDDMDHDGTPEVQMHDDGMAGDGAAGDGIYSAVAEDNGVTLTWTVAPNNPDGLASSGYVFIEARARYRSGTAEREVRMATLRANPVRAGGQ